MIEDLINKVTAHPATAYLLGFGALSVVLNLGLKHAKKLFTLSDRQLGRAVLIVGALGGMALQASALVILPGGNSAVKYGVAAFVGIASAFAAAGFSDVDLRDAMKGKVDVDSAKTE